MDFFSNGEFILWVASHEQDWLAANNDALRDGCLHLPGDSSAYITRAQPHRRISWIIVSADRKLSEMNLHRTHRIYGDTYHDDCLTYSKLEAIVSTYIESSA